jgi:hypothetical protein
VCGEYDSSGLGIGGSDPRTPVSSISTTNDVSSRIPLLESIAAGRPVGATG